MDAIKWPLTVLVIAVIFLILFKSQIKSLLECLGNVITRTKKLGVGQYGIEIQEKAAPQVAETRKGVDEFFRTFENPLIVEVEQNISKDLENRLINSPPDREKTLIRALASSIIISHFEEIRNSIWASQIYLLRFINSNSEGVDIAIAELVYEKAKSDYPSWFENYLFQGWIAFLSSRILIRQQDSKYFITIRGREFLKYLLDCGKPEPLHG